MLSEQSIRQYRAMSPKERFAIFLGLLDISGKSLAVRTPEHVRRCEETVRKERDQFAQTFFEHLDSLSWT